MQSNYLRISVTDYCNLDCIYCKSSKPLLHLRREELLNFEEIVEFVRLAKEYGVEKVRITGGEPLIKNDILLLLEMLREIPGLKGLCLTTNGTELKKFAPILRRIGIDSINVSLDTLNPEKFISITGKNELQNVLDGIITAKNLGIPVKINMVMLKGINETEIIEFLKFAKDNFIILRFVEYMPVGNEYNREWFFSNTIVRNKIEEYLGPLEPFYPFALELSGPAKYYKNSGLIIGFISAVSNPFCSTCNRIRLTIDGNLHPCLFSRSKFNIKDALREGNEQEVRRLFFEACESKKYICEGQKDHFVPISMSRIGG